jgi:phosphoribosylformylglycinamidine cyclo-ligase
MKSHKPCENRACIAVYVEPVGTRLLNACFSVSSVCFDQGGMLLPRKYTYSSAGVDRKLRARSKKALSCLEATYGFSRCGKVVSLPYGRIFPWRDCFLDLVIEGVGTKVLVAQLAERFDTIGIDGVAVAVNDVIRSGATPLAVADNIHAQVSDPHLISELMKGIVKGATEAECVVPSGEIGDVAELIRGLTGGKGFDLVFASVGMVDKEKVISGRGIKPGDSIVGMRSSGLHSNGISLARRVLFKQWGGKYEADAVPDGLDREVVDEVLEPTTIYVKPVLKAIEEIEVKAAVHVTGDAYMKFNKLKEFSGDIGFEFNNFKPQPVFSLIQNTAADMGGTITDEEMFKTFNMGWGFALIVDKKDGERTIDVLEKTGTQAEEIGYVTRAEGVKILYKNKRIILK